MTIGTRAANKTFLRFVVGALKKCNAKDKRNTMMAATETTSKFGPSGSLKNTNITLEDTIDAAPKIINGTLFVLMYESVMYRYTSLHLIVCQYVFIVKFAHR